MFYSSWYKAPVIGKEHAYELEWYAITSRKADDNSFEWFYPLESFGYYIDPTSPDTIQALAVSVDDEDLCDYVSVDIESGELTRVPNGECYLDTYYYELSFYTSIITKNSQGTYDAIYQPRYNV